MTDTLETKEPHPAAGNAAAYIKTLGIGGFSQTIEVFASTAIEGNRLSEICLGTMRRIKAKEPVSDRYLLGLAWTLKNMKHENYEEVVTTFLTVLEDLGCYIQAPNDETLTVEQSIEMFNEYADK